MSEFFGRRFELLLDDKIFIKETGGQQFRIVFNILVDFGGFTSYADIAIYNLSNDSALRAIKKGRKIGFRAGYESTIDFIFSGHISNVLRERDGPNTITRIIAKGGTQPTSQIINKTFGRNTPVTDIIRSCVTALGYQIEINEDDFASVPRYIKGYSPANDPRQCLDTLARAHKFSYTTEKDRIVVVGNDSFRGGKPLNISQFNGMEGIPEITEVGADVTIRLNPKVRIGGRIDIQSELVTFNFSNLYFQDIPKAAGAGIYRVFKLQHSGDSWGDTWSTDITGFR